MATISVAPGNIGVKSDRTNLLTYSITGTMSTITEKVNGTVVNTRATPTSGQSFIAGLTQEQWDAIKYGKYADATGGSNTLTVEMGTELWTYTFDKRLATDADILSAVKATQDAQTTFIPSVKTKLASAITSKGGSATGADSWDALVSAVDNGLGRKPLAGTVTSSASTSSFTNHLGNAVALYSVTVTGLSFLPSSIIIYTPNGTSYPVAFRKGNNYGGNASADIFTANATYFKTVSPAVVSNTSFVLPVGNGSTVYTWVAYE
jgi:hypothetical protein